jgi:hypothetical protein
MVCGELPSRFVGKVRGGLMWRGLTRRLSMADSGGCSAHSRGQPRFVLAPSPALPRKRRRGHAARGIVVAV